MSHTLSLPQTFQGNPDSICRPGAADATTILFAIGDHLYRRGRFDVADAVLAVGCCTAHFARALCTHNPHNDHDRSTLSDPRQHT